MFIQPIKKTIIEEFFLAVIARTRLLRPFGFKFVAEGGGASVENYSTYPLPVLRNEEAGGISACLCSAVASVAGCLCSLRAHIHTECGQRKPIEQFGYKRAHKYTH